MTDNEQRLRKTGSVLARAALRAFARAFFAQIRARFRMRNRSNTHKEFLKNEELANVMFLKALYRSVCCKWFEHRVLVAWEFAYMEIHE